MVWRLAKSLDTLSREIKTKYKGTTIWSIGDDKHKNTWSDHNPNDAGVVCAVDILKDGGLPLYGFVEHLIADGHPNLRYVIYQDTIYHVRDDFEGKEYSGSYHSHVHVSVGNGPDGRSTHDYDDTSSWHIADMDGTPSKPSKPSNPTQGWTDKIVAELPVLSEGSSGLAVNRAQALLNIMGAGLVEDGRFGRNTDRETREYQRRAGLVPDGFIGPKTWRSLLVGKHV